MSSDDGADGRLGIALLFGGRSSEHEISCVTAGGVLGAIDRSRYRVYPIGITREGALTLQPDDPAHYALDAEALPAVEDNGTRVRWPRDVRDRTLLVTDVDGVERELGRVDLAFPILHGRFGEDGTIQGQLELLDLPYVGSGVLASALGMDKHYTKTVLAQAGIPVVPWVRIQRAQWRRDRGGALELARAVGAGGGADPAAGPVDLFVKPAQAGSSVGVSKVVGGEGLAEAIDAAFAHDSAVLVERAVRGREVEFAVLGGADGAAPRVSLPGEIVVTGRAFYDFEAKYLGAAGVRLVCPAPLEAEQERELAGIAARAFEVLGCADLARVDFFVTADGPVVNEVNTMPGFTPISMFPSCWLASGLSYPALIDELIGLALARAEAARD